MRWWQDAGRPRGEVISRMEERGQQKGGWKEVRFPQQGQCITFRKLLNEKRLSMR